MLSEETSEGLAGNPGTHPKLPCGECARFSSGALGLPLDPVLMYDYDNEITVNKPSEFAGAPDQALAAGRAAVVDVKMHVEGIAPRAWTPQFAE